MDMETSLLSKIFRPQVLSMSGYNIADAKNLIKLDAMENPFAWPEEIQQQWLDVIRSCPINRYPDSESQMLSAALRVSNSIPEQSAILFGNGSDEIIQILLMGLPADARVISHEPGFVMYKRVSHLLGLNYRGIPLLDDTFELDVLSMLTAIEELQPALIFLTHPNNPTGNLFDSQSIETIISAAPGLVVIDEAFAPFSDSSFIGKLAAHDNLLVMRTLSKLGMAGLRLGFLVGSPDLLAQYNKVRQPFNINSLTQMIATFALKNCHFLVEQTRELCRQRDLVFGALLEMDNIKPYPSRANFILFRPIGIPSGQVFQAIKQQGILIKDLSSQGGILNNCLRVTIGTPEENQAFINALHTAISS
jgi:histidinol-phosphate aminotransferase